MQLSDNNIPIAGGVFALWIIAATCASAQTAPEEWSIRCGALSLSLGTTNGLALRGITAAGGAVARPHLGARQRLFQIRTGDEPQITIESTDMRVVSCEGSPTTGVISLVHDASATEARLAYRSVGGSEVDLRLSLRSARDSEARIVWPIIEGLWANTDPEDTWYFHPRSSGIYHNIPASIASNYGQYVRVQTMAAFALGRRGLYVIVKDTDTRRRGFELVKNVPGEERRVLHDEYGYPNWDGLSDQPGVGMAVQTLSLPLEAGKWLELPTVSVGYTSEGMPGVIKAYRRWAADWYHPDRARWFRDTFNYRAMRIFDAKTVDEVLDRLGSDSVDLLHYMVQAKHVNGEYAYREDWGVEGLRRLTSELRNRGVWNSHYIEGYITAKTSGVFTQHGDDWGQKRNGENIVAFANMAMCQSVPQWHRWLGDVCTGLVRDLDFDVVYLDELGWGTLDKFMCDHPRHEHPPKYCGIRSTKALLGHVRERLRKVKHDTPLLTEGPAVDQLFTVLDGVQDYGCRDGFHLPLWYRTPVHWLRHFFPDFKFFDIPAGLPSEQAWQLRRILFNGNGFLSHGHGPAATRALEERITKLYRLTRDAFASDEVSPMLPTNDHGVYANRFGGEGKQIITLCNVNEYPVAGELIDLPAAPGYHFVDLWRNEEVNTRYAKDRCRLVLELGAQDIAVVAQLKRRLQVTQDGLWFEVDPVPEATLVAVRVGADGVELEQSPIESGAPFSLLDCSHDGQDRVVIRAVAEGLLADQHELSMVADIDLARFAQATANNPDKPHGANPSAVNDGNIGSGWELKWDDPHPGWIQLTWSRPQRFNACHYRYSRSEYSPRESSLQYRNAKGDWVTILDKKHASDDSFEAVEADALRLFILQGGPWANHVAMTDWQVRFVPPGDGGGE